jgi:adhesin transport system outer membrane protein
MNRKSLTTLGACFVFSLNLWGISACKADIKPSAEPAPDKIYCEDSSSSTENKDSLPSKEYGKKYTKPLKTSSTSLSGIVQDALTYHPSIEADKHALSATDDVIDQAVAGYMPSIDLRASLGRENIRRDFKPNILNPLSSLGSVTSTRTDPSITLRQTIFDGMGTASRIARARSQRHQARGTLGVTTDTATVDAASATVDLRRLKRLKIIVERNIEFHKLMKGRVEEIVQAGAAPLSDLFQVEARLQDTYITQANINSELEVATAKFIEVVGKAPPDHIQRIRLPNYLIDISPDMAVRMALDNNSSIKVARSNVLIAESSHRETASKLVPSLTFELEGERDRNMSATSGFQNRLTAMLVARHNLFSGGADLAKSRETVKRLTEAHSRLNLAIRQTERTIRAAWGEARNARKKSAHLTKLIKEKRNIRSTYLEEFTLGKRTLMDVLDATNDVYITEATRTTVDATVDINIVVLSVGTGQFQRYLRSTDFEDGEENEFTPDPIPDAHYSEPEVQFTSYADPSPEKTLKTQEIIKVKKAPAKRKSVFDLRKEERLNTPSEKNAV